MLYPRRQKNATKPIITKKNRNFGYLEYFKIKIPGSTTVQRRGGPKIAEKTAKNLAE